MSYVGVVLLSHSRELVIGLKDLLQQIEPDVPLAIAGGLESGEIGTDVLKIKEAIESVYSEKGVIIFFDLGSAFMNAEMALEMLNYSDNIKVADAPLVEGAYVAIIESGCGGTLEDVVVTAEKSKNFSKIPK